jgi:diguanylate cyclase (GGDEF)-like protein/PAS domain S-box-containing protein
MMSVNPNLQHASTEGSLGRLVRLAGKIFKADGAFLLLDHDGIPTIAESFGRLPVSILVIWERVSKSIASSDDKGRSVFFVHGVTDGSLLATAAIQRNGHLLGILGVSNPYPGSLTPSQKYVLQAAAYEITDHLESDHTEIDNAQTTKNTEILARLRLLESVVVNANDSVLITEAEPIDFPGPRIQYVNPAFTRTTGYSFEEVIGKSPRILQGPLSGTEGPARIKAALKAWEPVEVELLNYRKDGSIFWVELSISPVCDEKGWFTHWVSVQRDVTERKEAEENAALMRVKTLQNEALTEEIRERKLVEAKLSHLAFHDSLTGLRNRMYFMDSLRVALERAQGRRGYRAAVIYLDLDGFKAINDTLGHRAGDLLLIEMGRRLKGCARVQDTLARMGGDEFTLLIGDLESMEQALEVAQRILEAIQAPFAVAGMAIQVTPSIGLCHVDGSYLEAEDILRDADTAMYRAKREGDGHYVIYDESMHTSALAALQMKQQIKAAVENMEFELYYQPLVNTVNHSIFGVEALVRWNHPSRGLLSPGDFIQIAEESGLILPLGAWVLSEACSHYGFLQSCSADRLFLSVNVSARQLDEATFLEDLIKVLEKNSIPAQVLQLEITESIFVKDAERIGKLFETIRALGVKIAFDDFGTGYSSLSYLERYPIDTLKIDQSFVQCLRKESNKSDIAEMIIRLAQGRDMQVWAEGVEEPEQEATLQRYGCTLVQGYLYSKPIDLKRIAVLLKNGMSKQQVNDA